MTGAAIAEGMGINARLLDGFELREGPHGPVPFIGGAELEVRFSTVRGEGQA